MARYIDADALDKQLKKMVDDLAFETHLEGAITGLKIRFIIHDQPTADVVEVVRCKDCIELERGMCLRFHNYVDSDNYCGYGERRKDG